MPYAVRARVRPWTAVLAILAVLLTLTLTAAGAANAARAQGDRPTAARTGAPPGPATVTYELTGALGQPLSGVRFIVYGEDNWSWTQEATTDAAGRATLTDIPEGPVRAQALTSAGYLDLGATTLVPGPQTVTFGMPGHGEVSGQISGVPDLRAEDSWSGCTYDSGYGHCVPLDTVAGTFAFTGIEALPAGDYDLALVPWQGEGGVGVIPVAHVTAVAGAARTADSDLGHLVATIRGTVTGLDGAPFVGTIESFQGNLPFSRTTIGADGRYELRVFIVGDDLTSILIRDRDDNIIDSAELELAGGTTTIHDVDLRGLMRASVRGTVIDDAGNALPGASVWVCHRFDCRTVVTAADGSYALDSIPLGPVRSNATLDGYIGSEAAGSAQTDGEIVTLDLRMTRIAALPPTVTLAGSYVSGGELVVPRAYRPLLSMRACRGGSVTWSIDFPSIPGVEFSGPMLEDAGEPGLFTATLPAAGSYSGLAEISLVATCPDGSTTTQHFNARYIDPSGTVVDPDGEPIAGATVVLQRSDSADGPFVNVPNGSDIMSPSNRVNPWTTNESGAFRWDVIAGYYRLQVSAPGYHVPGSDEATLTTQTWDIPPEVVGLELVLERDDVSLSEPTVTLSSGPKASVGQPVTLRAAVTGAAGRPTGTIDFALNGLPLDHCQDVALADGVATCTTTPTQAGSVTVAASYGGDSSYAAGTGTLSLAVAKGRQSVVVGSLAEVAVSANRTVTVSMKNSGLLPSAKTTTPRVCSLSTAVTGSDLSLTMRGLAIGMCSITVRQSGNADWHAADVTTVTTQVVQKAPAIGALEGRIEQKFARGLRTLTGVALTAGDGRDTVSVTVRTTDKDRARQRVTGVTGGGLTWKRVATSGSGGTIREQWVARSIRPVAGLVVKATLLRSAPASVLTVAVTDTARGSGGARATGLTR